MRLLIDECLTIDLIAAATEAGHEAQHIARIGKAGWRDWNVARYALDGGFALVTNNAVDFRLLYASQPIQSGLIIIRPSVNRAIQTQLFRGALAALVTFGEPINSVLEVDIEGDEAVFDVYELPQASE